MGAVDLGGTVEEPRAILAGEKNDRVARGSDAFVRGQSFADHPIELHHRIVAISAAGLPRRQPRGRGDHAALVGRKADRPGGSAGNDYALSLEASGTQGRGIGCNL